MLVDDNNSVNNPLKSKFIILKCNSCDTQVSNDFTLSENVNYFDEKNEIYAINPIYLQKYLPANKLDVHKDKERRIFTQYEIFLCIKCGNPIGSCLRALGAVNKKFLNHMTFSNKSLKIEEKIENLSDDIKARADKLSKLSKIFENKIVNKKIDYIISKFAEKQNFLLELAEGHNNLIDKYEACLQKIEKTKESMSLDYFTAKEEFKEQQLKFLDEKRKIFERKEQEILEDTLKMKASSISREELKSKKLKSSIEEQELPDSQKSVKVVIENPIQFNKEVRAMENNHKYIDTKLAFQKIGGNLNNIASVNNINSGTNVNSKQTLKRKNGTFKIENVNKKNTQKTKKQFNLKI